MTNEEMAQQLWVFYPIGIVVTHLGFRRLLKDWFARRSMTGAAISISTAVGVWGVFYVLNYPGAQSPLPWIAFIATGALLTGLHWAHGAIARRPAKPVGRQP